MGSATCEGDGGGERGRKREQKMDEKRREAGAERGKTLCAECAEDGAGKALRTRKGEKIGQFQ